MSNPRGASGANKSRLHNVNSVYSGKNTAATKASGPGKHGLQPLGKATAVVRRMPPPATLPSLKAEHGQDPLISIVPQGGTGWTTKSTSSTDTEANKQNGSTDISGGNAPDLRPTWAKSQSSNSSTAQQGSTENTNAVASLTMTNFSNNSQQSQGGTAAQIVQGTAAAPPNNRDFPSLAASVAAGSKSDTGSLKPQKTSAWGTNLADANVEIPHIPVVSTQQNQSGGYIGASTAPKPHVERIIPQRYISSQPPVTQSRVAAKIGIREKLARFSMESKEPSVDAENKAASEQEPAKMEASPVTESPKVVPSVAPQQQPTTPAAPINQQQQQQQFSQPPPQLRSQDVRQLQPSQFPLPEHQQQQQPPSQNEWQSQERFVNGAPPPYNNSYDQQQQKLLQNGRGEGGYAGPRGVMPQQQQQQHGGYHHPGGGIVGQQRFDDRGNPYGERQIEELGWGDDLPIDNRRGMINNQNRNNRYRIDSRSSTEADSNTWQGPPQHYGQQQQQVGPPPPRQQQQQQMAPQNAGWYDNSGYPLVPGQDYNTPPPQSAAQYPSGNNYNNHRSRNSSVATADYNNYDQQQQQQQHPKGPPRRHQEFDYRQQGYQGYPPGGPPYHDVPQQQHHGGHDNQQQQHRNMPHGNRQHPPPQQQLQHPPSLPQQPHQQQQQQQQQQRYQQPEMPYRMLKRNDEKSAEYIAHHGGGPILQQQQQSSVEEETTKSKTKESKSRSPKSETSSSEASKATTISSTPKENVWEKRMEERKKEVVSTKSNSRFQQELDYNFPSINDVPKDINEWNPPPPLPPAATSDSLSGKNLRKGPRRNDSNGQYQQQHQHSREHQRTPRNVETVTTGATATAAAVPLDPETLGSSHWVQEKTGPSWDNLSIPADHRPEEPPLEEDDVYTGTKREFVNSKRSRGGSQYKAGGDFASRDIRQKRGDSTATTTAVSSGIVNGKKPSSTSSSVASQKPAFDPTTKRSSRAEDNFSNMGEFHAEDYKIAEEAAAAAATTTSSSSTTTKKQYRPRENNTFESNEGGGGGGYDASRRGSKRGVPRQPRGNNNWKGSERLPRSAESQREASGNDEQHFERYDTSAVSSRGNGRRLAPMGGNGRGSSRFLSKHTNKPTRHKQPHFEGGALTTTSTTVSTKSSNRASADRNVEGLKSPAASEGVDEWETASESSDVGGRDEQPPPPLPQQPEQRERKNLPNGIRNSTKYQSNNTNSDTNSNISSNSKDPSQNDEISSSKSTTTSSSTSRNTNQKNVNPASHTYLGNGVSAKSSNAYNNKSNISSSNGYHQPLQQNNKHRLHTADTSKAETIKENNARENRKGFGSHISNNNGNSNNSTTTTTTSINMGLAGVDINDASVIVIDNQPDIEIYSEEAGDDFEEVISKKQKKQRQLQVEEERRKEQKEKEKAEKIQARKKQALQEKQQLKLQRAEKSGARKSQEKSVEKEVIPATIGDSKKMKQPIILPSTATSSAASPIRKNVECDLGTSIWNNTLTASNSSNSIVEKPHIPSPIARPTKSAIIPSPSTVIPTTITPIKSAAAASSLTIDVNAVKEDFEKFTIATSTVPTAATTSASSCYDFAYDSTVLKTSSASPLGVKSSPNQLSTKEVVIVSKPSKDTIIDLNSDHVQLKEKLDKVKDFWPGQVDFEPALENGHIDKTSLSQAHGPNVAKVKPQPQHHDLPQQHQQQPTQILQFIPSEVKAAKSIETTFNAFAIPPSQSPNLYQRGNAVFTMGPTSPFRQISSTHQIYPMAYGSNTNDYIQQQQHYGGGQQQHTSSSTINQSFFGGQIQQPQPSRPQSYDGMFNSNQLWNNNGIDILLNPTPPLQQQQQQQQINQTPRYISNSRPPSHPSTTNISMPPNGFPPTHLPPPLQHMGGGYQQQPPQPLQFQQQQHVSNNSYIPTHIPPPSLPPPPPQQQQHTYIELMAGPPPPQPPPIGPPRNNGNSRTNNNLITQSHQQNNNNNNNFRPQQMHILRPQQQQQQPYNHIGGIVQFQPQQLQQQQYHQQHPHQGTTVNGNMPRNNNQQQQNWQKHEPNIHHQPQNHQHQQNMNGHPSTTNYGGYFNVKYTTNQPTA